MTELIPSPVAGVGGADAPADFEQAVILEDGGQALLQVVMGTNASSVGFNRLKLR